VSPQWSPPLNGGTTRQPQAPVGAFTRAAMEPAAERRDDGPLVFTQMGPVPLPQWSPPLNGGTTAR
jgi:hypothetical protein